MLLLWILVPSVTSESVNLIAENQIGEITTLSGNTLKSYNVPFFPQPQVLGVKLATRNDLKELLVCLIGKESEGNPFAYNPKDVDGKEKFGCLQYDRETFSLCESRYGLGTEIYNCEIQKQCFIRMYNDGEGFRWPPLKKCQF